jgi:hypothetical protein
MPNPARLQHHFEIRYMKVNWTIKGKRRKWNKISIIIIDMSSFFWSHILP